MVLVSLAVHVWLFLLVAQIFDGARLVAVTQGRAYCFLAMCQLLSHPDSQSADTVESSGTGAW